ncbi:DEAD/DEAH box helicase [Kitasatospora sp. NA04385]|uniref:DEAD/DEAH box helicase n=1 Tax=Kitasatospora sp. NA04385 TaxID=2742135 RepID=UPI00159158CE|nr:DEAD/DEAH box helicase [Kitasatospora sp. NA04385]QKW22248.1 DEAD/DEAH box helicase [Kitasatospora sp. NA04385]
MERTLDLQVLTLALGDHSGAILPAPAELLALLTELEINAVRAGAGVPEEVLNTAWLLHGLAAVSPGAADYDPAQVRHAFAVSAHVLDLALAGEHDDTERLKIAFAAQAGYRRCEQDPNATAVYRTVERLVTTDAELPDHIETLALEAGVAFLGMDRPKLTTVLRAWRHQLAQLRALLGRRFDRPDTLAGTMYGPAEAVVNAVHHLHQHLAFGDQNDLDTAVQLLGDVVAQQTGTGDLLARWVASHLLELSEDLSDSSLYQLLPPGTPPAVARTFALSSPPVLTLWPPQRKLLELERGNPVDPATTRSLISVPTSAGKTLMAQLVICAHLAQARGRVLYVSPMRSLGREMRQALRGRLRLLGRRLAADLPDFPISDRTLGNLNDDVEILTPERLMHMLRHDPVEALDGVGLIVVDEAHHMAQAQRGFVLEGLLAFCQVHPGAPRLVLLSAAVGNRAALASWLDPTHPPEEVFFSDTWRGPRRLHGLLSPHYMRDRVERTERKPTKRARGRIKAVVPMALRMALRPTTASKPTVLLTRELGRRSFAETYEGDWSRDTLLAGGTANYQLFAAGAAYLTTKGSVLMVVSTRKDARNTARAIADHLEARAEAEPLAVYLSETLGEEHPLVSCARKGVAYHHGALPDDVLEAIEDALRTGQLLAIASTSTLTDGVNLPVRTVIVHHSIDGDFRTYERQRQMTDAELLNAVGRAGRAGRESEGWILLTRQVTPTTADFDRLTPRDDQLHVTSALLDAQVLEQLAEAENRVRNDADEVLKLAGTLVADFAAYVWFTVDALGSMPALDITPLKAVENLPALQLVEDPQVRSRWLSLAEKVAAVHAATNPVTRRRWATTGTSLFTARNLDELARWLTFEIRALTAHHDETQWEGDFEGWSLAPDEWPLRRTLDFLAEHRVLDTLLGLPEVEGNWRFTDREHRGSPLEVPVSQAITDWTSGLPIPRLAQRWLPTVERVWALEQTVDNISRTFEHALSWTLGALIHLVNTQLSDFGSRTRLHLETGWYLRHGVDTAQALKLLTSGITSRRLAHAMGSVAASQHIPSADMKEWVSAWQIDGWLSLFQATPREIDELLEYVRQPRDLIGELIGGRTVSVDVVLDSWREPAVGEATLERPTPDSPTLSVFVGPIRAGYIQVQHQVDVLAVLDSGLPLSLFLVNGQLTIARSPWSG